MKPCPYCKKQNEYDGLCFERGPHGDNISSCAIFYRRTIDSFTEKKRMKIPERMRTHELMNFRGPEIVAHAKSILDRKHLPPTILIAGETVGCGKSHLAVGMLYEYSLKIPETVKFSNFMNIMDEIYQALQSSSEHSPAEVVTKYSEIGVLLIDDLGVGNTTEYQLGVLFQIINNRYESGKVTLITTNLTGSDLVEKFDKRIADRICNGEVIVLKGASGRRVYQNVKEFEV